MNPINIPAIETGAAGYGSRPAADKPVAATLIAATHFSHYPVLGDGDCLFRAMSMGLTNQPGIEPSQVQVMALRQYLANYVYQQQDALAANPAFEGRSGVLNLYDLLLTPGQWNHNAGDLVPPLLAQVSGRPVAVLQSAQNGTAFSVRQIFPPENPTLPTGAARTGEATICLAHIDGNHYGYLEERYPNVLSNALDQMQHVRQSGQDTGGQALLDSRERYSIYNKSGKKALDEGQTERLVQLWQANPSWGKRKLASEFMRLYPEEQVSKDVIQVLKDEYPGLQSSGLGSLMRKKKLSQSQEAELVQLLHENPRWSHAQLSSEFSKSHPQIELSHSLVWRLKTEHPSLKGRNLCRKKNEKKLSDAQQEQVVQLWWSNPTWSSQKIANEFNKRNPGVNISLTLTQRIKRSHPGLQGLSLGVKKRLSDEQEKHLAQLWQANPRWTERKIADEFSKLNPEVKITRGMVNGLKGREPTLAGLGLSAPESKKKLSAEQERELLQLWRDNPSWSSVRVTREFMAHNPGIKISDRLALRAKARHSDWGAQ